MITVYAFFYLFFVFFVVLRKQLCGGPPFPTARSFIETKTVTILLVAAVFVSFMSAKKLCSEIIGAELFRSLSHILDEQLGYLYRVGRRALAHLIAAAPQIEPALIGQILAYPADEDDVLIARG